MAGILKGMRVVEGSALSTIQKALLTSLIDQAETSPELLGTAEEVIREAIAGLEASD